MNKLLLLLLLAAVLTACGETNTAATESEETTTEPTEETMAEESSPEYVAIDSDEALLATALMAAPAASREGAKVIGFNMAGEFVTMKEGTNTLICLADDPKKEGFNAACYHQALEPFMARGRELKAEGKNANEIFDIREQEAKAGDLDMGPDGTTLHIYYGPDAMYDPETNEVAEAQYRYVVYMPFATAASTGLPESPISPNHPWIMNPGTHRAHIMITPLK